MKFRKETEFQETEIGKIPREWKTVKLSSIARIIMGQSPPSDTYNREGLGMPFLQGKMEFGRMYPSPTTYTTQPLKIAEPNDILISVRAPVGDVNIAPYKVCIGRGLAAIRFNPKTANHMFYFYYFQYIKKQLETLGKGSTFKAITKKDLEELLIPLPPIKEQEKVSGILTMIDKTIELYHEERERLDRLKRGLMGELLTGRIRVREENGRLSFYRETELQETEIGEIPRDWHVAKLGELIEMNHGERPEVILQEGDVPIYGGGGLYGFTNTYLVDKPYVLILARVGKGSVGKVYLARGRVWVTDNAIYGYSKDPNGITTVYAYYWLLFDKTWIEKYVRRSAGGYAIITLNSLNNLKLPLPPLNEQKGITKILSTIDKAVDLHYKGKERLERLKRSLMDLLLTGKVRVVDGDVGS
jgi:type I restriction enzyme S subunit